MIFVFETLPCIENDATLCYLLPLLSVQTPAEGLNPAQQLSTSLTEPPPYLVTAVILLLYFRIRYESVFQTSNGD